MKRTNLLHLLLAVLLFTISSPNTSSHAADGTNKKSKQAAGIGLGQLLRTFMLPAEANYNVVSWRSGSLPDTPIEWNHRGLKNCSEYVQRHYGTAYCRAGSVEILINGQPTHTVLGKVIEAGRWDITLMGSRSGVGYVSIYSNAISPELSAGLLEEAEENNPTSFSVALAKNCGYPTSSQKLYTVAARNEQPALVQEVVSCGSAGCSVEFVMTYRETDALRLLAEDGACSNN